MKTKNKMTPILVKTLFVVVLIAVWEILSKSDAFGKNTSLVFPSVEAILQAFVNNFRIGYAGASLWVYIGNSMKLLAEGLGIGIVLAFVLSGLSIIFGFVKNMFELLISVCDLLPGIALLPVVIIMFGIREEVVVFLVVHAVLWPLSRNILDGFFATSQMYIDAGKNIGLSKVELLCHVYIPASAAQILSGLKVGWARAWRGLISAEMIFGLASAPGIGLFINQMRSNLNNAEMCATLLVIVIIGLIVQYAIFTPIEKNTIRKWGLTKL